MTKNRKIQAFIVFLIMAVLLFGGIYIYQQAQLLELMNVTFGGASISNLSLKNITLQLTLKFTNVSAVDITIQKYDFDVYVNGHDVMKITPPPPFTISANSTTSSNVTVSFDPSTVLADIFSGDVISALLFDYSKVIIEVKGPVTVKGVGITVSNYQVDESQPLSELVNSGS